MRWGLMRRPKAVSYTHLAVYKRQRLCTVPEHASYAFGLRMGKIRLRRDGLAQAGRNAGRPAFPLYATAHARREDFDAWLRFAAEYVYARRGGCLLYTSFKILGHSQRVQGFREVCEKDYPRMAIRAVAETDDDDATAYQETRKMLLEHPDIRARYFCAGGIDGGIRAVSDLNRVHSIRIITVDDTDNIKEYIRRGIVNATVCQQPFKQGRDAVSVSYTHLDVYKRQSWASSFPSMPKSRDMWAA